MNLHELLCIPITDLRPQSPPSFLPNILIFWSVPPAASFVSAEVEILKRKTSKKKTKKVRIKKKGTRKYAFDQENDQEKNKVFTFFMVESVFSFFFS